MKAVFQLNVTSRTINYDGMIEVFLKLYINYMKTYQYDEQNIITMDKWWRGQGEVGQTKRIIGALKSNVRGS